MNNFITSCRKLVDSLIIKDTSIGVAFYKKLYKDGKIKIEDLKKQLAILYGEYHTSNFDFVELLKKNKYLANITGDMVYDYDTPIKFKILENDELNILSKDTLEKFADTKKELLKCSDYYNNLINDNLEYIDFIHGVMYPSDILDIYNKQDGYILGYNSNFVETQEDYLIEAIQSYVYKYLGLGLSRRYANNNPLYVPAYHFILKTYLYNYVMELRLAKINTMQAHSFFIKAKLSSKLDIYNEISNFKTETIMWTYRNIDRLMAHAGTNKVFQELLQTILNENGVGIGSYICRREDIRLSTGEKYKNRYDYLEPPMSIPDPKIIPYPLNESYVASKDTTINLEDVDRKLISSYRDFSVSPIRENTNYEVEMNKAKIVREYGNEFDTKVIEISTLTEYTSFNFDIFKTILDYWGYFVKLGLYGSTSGNKKTTVIEFFDPSSKKTVNLDASSGFKFAICVICHAAGIRNINSETYQYSNVIDWNKAMQKVVTRTLLQDKYTELLLPILNKIYPGDFKETSSVTMVGRYLERVISFLKYYWVITSNVENDVTSSNLYKLMQEITISGHVEVVTNANSISLDKLTQSVTGEGLSYFAGEYNHFATLNELFKALLGINVSNEIRVAELLKSYRNLIKKMTSYTVDVIGNTSNLNVVNVNYQHLAPLFSNKGVLKLFEEHVHVQPLEQNWYQSHFDSYEPDEKARIHNYLDKTSVVAPHRGRMEMRVRGKDEARLHTGVKVEMLDRL